MHHIPDDQTRQRSKATANGTAPDTDSTPGLTGQCFHPYSFSGGMGASMLLQKAIKPHKFVEQTFFTHACKSNVPQKQCTR